MASMQAFSATSETAGSNPSQSFPAWIIAAVACLVYAVTLGNPLVLDDAQLIPNQVAIRHPWDVAGLLMGRYWGSIHEWDTLYRPLVIWSLALNAQFNRFLGLDFDAPALYHAVNIALHAAVSVLLYRFALRLKVRPAGAVAAGLIFAVHPIHTEAVAAIVNRSELLAALFGLSFLIQHLDGRRTVLTVGWLLLALFSKESAIAWIPLAVWIDLVSGKRSWARYTSYLAAVLVWFGLRAMAIRGIRQDIPFLDNPLVNASLAERWMTAARVQLDYLQLQILPFGLSSDYSAYQIPLSTSLFEPRVLLFSWLAAMLAVAAWKLRHRSPLFVIALGGYTFLLGPTANIVFPIGTMMAERLVYAPSLFSALLVGLAWQRVRSRAVVCIGILVVLVLAGATVHRNLDWTTSDRFYLAQVRSAPKSAKAHYSVARNVYYPRGDIESAKRHYLRAIEIYPGFAMAWNNLGSAYLDSHDPAAAMDAFERALSIQSDLPEANMNLGGLLQRQGDLDGALLAYERALRAGAIEPTILNNMAMIHISRDQPGKAKALLMEALRLAPDYALARENLKRLARWHGTSTDLPRFNEGTLPRGSAPGWPLSADAPLRRGGSRR